MCKVLIGILFVLIIFVQFCPIMSSFGSVKQETTPIEDNNKTLIFYAPWCGHCKASKLEFEAAVKNSNGKVILVNGDENPELVKKYKVDGYPTIMKGSQTYNGPRKSKDIVEFANE